MAEDVAGQGPAGVPPDRLGLDLNSRQAAPPAPRSGRVARRRGCARVTAAPPAGAGHAGRAGAAPADPCRGSPPARRRSDRAAPRRDGRPGPRDRRPGGRTGRCRRGHAVAVEDPAALRPQDLGPDAVLLGERRGSGSPDQLQPGQPAGQEPGRSRPRRRRDRGNERPAPPGRSHAAPGIHPSSPRRRAARPGQQRAPRWRCRGPRAAPSAGGGPGWIAEIGDPREDDTAPRRPESAAAKSRTTITNGLVSIEAEQPAPHEQPRQAQSQAVAAERRRAPQPPRGVPAPRPSTRPRRRRAAARMKKTTPRSRSGPTPATRISRHPGRERDQREEDHHRPADRAHDFLPRALARAAPPRAASRAAPASTRAGSEGKSAGVRSRAVPPASARHSRSRAGGTPPAPAPPGPQAAPRCSAAAPRARPGARRPSPRESRPG